MGTKKKKLKWPLIFFISFLLACSLWLTISPHLGFSFQTAGWEDVFSLFGLRDQEKITQKEYIAFLDVGQGDCALLHSEDATILVDAGGADTQEQVLDFLQRNEIVQVDAFIATHPHADHIGGAEYLFNHIPVKQLYLPDLQPQDASDQEVYQRMLTCAQQRGIQVCHPAQQEQLQFANLTLKLLQPTPEASDENDRAIVVLAQWQKMQVLLMADAGKEVERRLLDLDPNLQCDILKVGHHGSSTATGETFLKNLRPQFATISVGENGYGHPTKEVTDRLARFEVEVYRTDVNGTVVFYWEEDKIQVQTDR